jgi:hypothetical protein
MRLRDVKPRYRIFEARQIGNVGAHEIKAIEEQPKEGYDTEKEAELSLRKKIASANEWLFNGNYPRTFVVLKVWEIKMK